MGHLTSRGGGCGVLFLLIVFALARRGGLSPNDIFLVLLKEGDDVASSSNSNSNNNDFYLRMVLAFANFLSLILALYVVIIRWGLRSWFITREVFPAKIVACNIIVSATWTVYMTLNMYVEGKYIGQEAIIVSCLIVGINLINLFVYFLNGEENIKLWISFIVFMLMTIGGMFWLIWHPDVIQSDERKIVLKSYMDVCGVIGMVLFAVMNIAPFGDLISLTFGEQSNITLLVLMTITSLMSCISYIFFAIYGWMSAPKPNYFMCANLIAASLTFIRAVWLYLLCIVQRGEIEYQIIDVESLRSVLISVSNSLCCLGSVSQAYLWKSRGNFINLQGSLRMGIHSLCIMELTLNDLYAELKEEAAVISSGLNQNTSIGESQSISEATIVAAVRACCSFSELCKEAIGSLQAVENGITRKLSGAREEATDLRDAIQVASTHMRVLADEIRPVMHIIHASRRMLPLTIRKTCNYCTKQLLLVKTSADRWFFILGVGAFGFRNILKKSWKKLMSTHGTNSHWQVWLAEADNVPPLSVAKHIRNGCSAS